MSKLDPSGKNDDRSNIYILTINSLKFEILIDPDLSLHQIGAIHRFTFVSDYRLKL